MIQWTYSRNLATIMLLQTSIFEKNQKYHQNVGLCPREIPRSSPASPRKTPSIPPLLLGLPIMWCMYHTKIPLLSKNNQPIKSKPSFIMVLNLKYYVISGAVLTVINIPASPLLKARAGKGTLFRHELSLEHLPNCQLSSNFQGGMEDKV